jgi:hypothetical protein
MGIVLYIIGWILILLFIVGLTLVIFYSRRIDQCRTYKTLYCHATEANGWRCTNADPANPTTTLAAQIAGVQSTVGLVPCPSNADTPASGTNPAVFASYVLAPADDGTANCNTNLPDSQLPDGCKSTGPLKALINFPGDPLVVPSNGIVLPSTVFNWYCDPTMGPNSDLSTKRAAWKAFIALNPDFQKSQPIVFAGAPPV